MKAKELMVGDWVIYRGEPTIVYEIDDYYQRINTEPDGYDSIKCIDISEIEPIPITPEILEKNGFKMKQKEGESNFEYVAAGERYIIEFLFFRETIYNVSTLLECELGFSGGLDRIHKCNVKYVHELQHALRLCGIEKEIEL